MINTLVNFWNEKIARHSNNKPAHFFIDREDYNFLIDIIMNIPNIIDDSNYEINWGFNKDNVMFLRITDKNTSTTILDLASEVWFSNYKKMVSVIYNFIQWYNKNKEYANL